MNINLNVKRIFFYSILIASVQIISCTKAPDRVTQPSTPTPPTTSPSTRIAFWTNEGSRCLCEDDSIRITVNNTTKIARYYYGPSVKNCNDDPHAAIFELMPGTYPWLAVRGKDTLRGSVTIYANDCIVQEVF